MQLPIFTKTVSDGRRLDVLLSVSEYNRKHTSYVVLIDGKGLSNSGLQIVDPPQEINGKVVTHRIGKAAFTQAEVEAIKTHTESLYQAWDEHLAEELAAGISDGTIHPILMESGHYLMDKELTYAQYATSEEIERSKYRPELLGRLMFTVPGAPIIKLSKETWEQAKPIHTEQSNGCPHGEGYIWIITQEQWDDLAGAQGQEESRKAAERAAAKQQRETESQAKFDEAKTTGQPVLLGGGMEECDGSAVDCSLDYVATYALPDGTTCTERTHTH